MAKKKEKATPKSMLEITRQAITKKYGEGVIRSLGDHEDLQIDAISTGCLSLDSALGVGGFARGRLYEVYGPNSSGKSTLALSVCMQAIKRNMNVAYIDAEHSLSPQLVRNMGDEVGVDVDKIDIIQAFTGDDNLEIAEIIMKSGEMGVVVVDSVSALLPQAMAEGEIGDNYIGQLARLVSKACSKLTPVVNRTNTLLILINQVRIDIGRYGDNKVPTGGASIPFYATGRIKVDGGEFKSSRIINDDGVVIGHESKFMVIKNKLAAPWREAKINLIYGQGYDFVAEVVDLSIDFGFISQAGSWFELNGGERIQGKKTLVDTFRENKDLYNELRAKVKQTIGLKDDE